LADPDAPIDRAIQALVAVVADALNAPDMRDRIAAILDAQVNPDVDNTTLPLKLGSRLSPDKRARP
jgi:hypothetical protein